MPTLTQPRSPRATFSAANPILRVSDMRRSIDYYTRVLGFELQPWGNEKSRFVMVTRDKAGIYLCLNAQGNPGTWLWIGAGDVEALHDEFKRAGATIRQGPNNFSWAYELRVEDPDGHVLRFGSEPKTDRPFEDHLA